MGSQQKRYKNTGQQPRRRRRATSHNPNSAPTSNAAVKQGNTQASTPAHIPTPAQLAGASPKQQDSAPVRSGSKQQLEPERAAYPKPGPKPPRLRNKQHRGNQANNNQAGTKAQEKARAQAATPANLAQRGKSATGQAAQQQTAQLQGTQAKAKASAAAGTRPKPNPRKAQNGQAKPARRTQEMQAPQSAPNTKRKAGSKRNANRGPLKPTTTQHSRRTPTTRKPRLETQDEVSAGGLVFSGLAEAVDHNNKVDLSKIYVALIGRLDRRGRILWSIPKGHVEGGEDIIKTAEREVWEETGVYGEVFDKLGIIDYWFISDGIQIHKTVHHHLLRYVDGELNDEDPEVTEVAWIPASELTEHFAYADERKLARKIYRILPNIARAEKEAGRRTPRP